jgi:hypothetical protein
MARIRSVKPEFWSSEQVMSCSPLARLLFIGIWNFCDDGGNHPLSPRTIKALVFPGDDITVESVDRLLAELKSSGLIAMYCVDGKTYLHVRGWHHQKIDKRTFKYPAFVASPDDSSHSSRRVLGEESSNSSGGLTPGRDVDVDVDVDVDGSGEDQHNSHNASEPDLVSEPDPTTEKSSAVAPEPIDPPTPEEEPPLPVNPLLPSEMNLEWVPDQGMTAAYAKVSMVQLDAFTPEAVGAFVCHYAASGRFETHAKWVQLMVAWIKRNQATDASRNNVRPFQKPATPSRHTLTGTRDYKAGTKENANGTFRL